MMNNEVKYVRENGMNKVLFDNSKMSIDSDTMRMGYHKYNPIDITSSIHGVLLGDMNRYELTIAHDIINVIRFVPDSTIRSSDTLLKINKDGIIFNPDTMWNILEEIIYTINRLNTTIAGSEFGDFIESFDVWDAEYIDENDNEYEWAEV